VSGTRRLWIRFRRVEPHRLPAYLEAIAELGGIAQAEGIHAWVFEADGDDRLFIEFLEGPGDEALAGIDARAQDLLGSAAGGLARQDYRCSEIRPSD
jgi:hypothetical protein